MTTPAAHRMWKVAAAGVILFLPVISGAQLRPLEQSDWRLVNGTAEQASYVFSLPRVNLGRCAEVRDSRSLVVIDHVEMDERYCRHETPRRYGFQSYISAPIHLPDGSF